MSGLIVLIVIGAILALGAAWITQRNLEDAFMSALAAGVVVVITLIIMTIQWVTNFSNDHWATCHVTGKDRGGNDGSYRVYTDDCGVLSNHDTWLRGKVNSADVWQSIPKEGDVRLHIAGSRVQIFSKFPNILEVEPVKE